MNKLTKSDILYADSYLIAVYKPAGLMVEPDKFGNPNAVDQVLTLLDKKPKLKGGIGVVYRLDRPVSGVLVFALTPLALKNMNEQVALKKVVKIYRARLEGELAEKAGSWKANIDRSSDRKTAIITPKGQRAVTHYKVVGISNGMTDVEIRLETGRFHQIRAHAAHAGHPIVGDVTYGAQAISSEGILLEASEYRFTHPKTDEALTISTGDRTIL